MSIERLHLEQDAGKKSIHDIDPTNTYVDLNRSGIALMEIVKQTRSSITRENLMYIKKIRTIMR